MRNETVYAADPVVAAKRFIDAGATRLHVVDLDAARGVPATRERRRGRAVGCDVRRRRVRRAGRWRHSRRRHRRALARRRRLAGDPGQRGGARPRQRARRSALRSKAGSCSASTFAPAWRGCRAGPRTGRAPRSCSAPGARGPRRASSTPTRPATACSPAPTSTALRTCRELYGGPVIASGGISSRRRHHRVRRGRRRRCRGWEGAL